METNPNPGSDVLHSENHSKLSAEEVAKALARHNREHPSGRTERPAQRPKKGGKH
jgi:hypothetical protein